MINTAELREKLIVEIKNIDDDELLIAVNDGIYQIENGMSVSNEEARKIFDKCLGK